MSNHTPGTTYSVYAADVAAARATEIAAIGTANTILKAALSAAQAAYKPNDGGVFQAALNAAYKTYDASVAAAYAASEPAILSSSQQHKTVLRLPE